PPRARARGHREGAAGGSEDRSRAQSGRRPPAGEGSRRATSGPARGRPLRCTPVPAGGTGGYTHRAGGPMRTRRDGEGDRNGTSAVPEGTAPMATSPGPQLARPPLEPVSLSEVHAARRRIGRTVLRTPLVRLEGGADRPPLWLKLECLQPIGSFKLRGAANALALADRASLARGVYTASAGNMAQGVAYGARALGIPCRVIVPEGAPRAKLGAIERLGAAHVPVPFDAWWEVLRRHAHPDEGGHFVHPVADP